MDDSEDAALLEDFVLFLQWKGLVPAAVSARDLARQYLRMVWQYMEGVQTDLPWNPKEPSDAQR